jgi:hypothetical protein
MSWHNEVLMQASISSVAAVAAAATAMALVGAATLDASDGGRSQAHAQESATGQPCTTYVAGDGADTNPGTSSSPRATLRAAFAELEPGDVLCVRSGTYAAPSLAVPPGTAAARITVQPDEGARPVVVGPTSLVDPDYWTIRGLTWTAPGTTARIVSLLAGSGWVFEDNEVTDGDSVGLLVGKSTVHGNPHDYTIRRNTIHDTAASNLYLNPGRESRGGLIERNLFFNSGTQNVKVGWGGSGSCTGSNYGDFGVGEVTVRFNTMHNAGQPFTVAEPGGELPVTVYRNLITGGTRGFAVRLDNVEGCLQDNVRIFDNLAFGGDKFAEDFGHAPAIMSELSNNVFPHDPKYDGDGSLILQPRDDLAATYGRYAPMTVPG